LPCPKSSIDRGTHSQACPGFQASLHDQHYFSERTVLQLSSDFLRDRLQVTCTILRGQPTFGYTQADISTKSLRSGAAMSLFLMNHSTKRIMLLGRWRSDAFLVHIRPQVLEWTNHMSRNIIRHDSFLGVVGCEPSRYRLTPHPTTPVKWTRQPPCIPFSLTGLLSHLVAKAELSHLFNRSGT
jgi:hypothetical protein